jgi:predicted DCC family thiol-disulfide oxidoreductase YuxK
MGISKLERIVFYDGECGLCSRSVAFLSQVDRKKKLLFAPLNGETYQNIFPAKAANMDTVLFSFQGKVFIKSEAIINAIASLGGFKKGVLLFKLIPRWIRDRVYDFIAGHRKKVSCIILPRDQRFLK